MKFPNAANGVKKLFTAEILQIIAAVALAAAAIMGLVKVQPSASGQEHLFSASAEQLCL